MIISMYSRNLKNNNLQMKLNETKYYLQKENVVLDKWDTRQQKW